MGDHNAGDADLLDDVDELELHFGSELLVEGAHRLVKEQKLRMGCKGSCEGHALALSAGKLVGLSVSEFLHVDKGEHLLDVLLDLVLRHMLLLESEGDIVPHGHVREKRVGLEHHVHRPLVRRNVGEILAVKDDLAACRLLESGKHPEKR